MSQNVLFVSVNRSYRSWMTIADLETCVERAWAISAAKADSCDRVVAVIEGFVIACWRLRGAFPTDETYSMADGSTRPRIGLSLGDPMPVLPDYQLDPSLRRGVAVVKCEVEPLPPVTKPE